MYIISISIVIPVICTSIHICVCVYIYLVCMYVHIYDFFSATLRSWQHLRMKRLIIFLSFGRIFFRGGPVCLCARTALPLGALLSGHPLYEHALWFPLSHLVLGRLKTGLAALLGNPKPQTGLYDRVALFSCLTVVKADACVGQHISSYISRDKVSYIWIFLNSW